MTKNDKKWHWRTQMIHGGGGDDGGRSQYGETSEALYLTSGYVYQNAEQARARFADEDEGYIYSRFGNPTVRIFEERMRDLEGADDARATATGMSAVATSLLCFLRKGDHVISARALFGSCRFVIEDILPRYGIEVSLIDGTKKEEWQSACRANTRAFFLETPSNPLLEIIDLEAVSQCAHNIGALLIVDNVFATQIAQRPMEWGADIVVYSATKYIDGQGRCLGGVILGKKNYIDDDLSPFYRNMGPTLSPFNAWVMLKGLETLELRFKAHCQNAHRVAQFLDSHKKIDRVVYPALTSHPQYELAQKQMSLSGGLVSFTIKGGRDEAFAFLNHLGLIKISNNLGDTKSLITHPETTTHARLSEEQRDDLGIGANLVRLSVGLEDCEDICQDLDSALHAKILTAK